MSSATESRRNSDPQQNGVEEGEWASLPSHHDTHRKDAARPSSLAHVSRFLRWHAFSPLPECKSGDPMPAAYIPPLFLQCMIAGFADATTYTLTQSWVGFMTGNLVQFIINCFNLAVPPSVNDGISHGEDRRRLVLNLSALVGFTIGCQITANAVKRIANDRTLRITLALLQLFRSTCTFIIVLGGAWRPSFRLQGSLAWLVIAILSSNLGCQASYSTFLNTPFSNTVVFTATLASVTSDVGIPLFRLSKGSQLKLLSIVGLLVGAVLSQIFLKLAVRASERAKHLAIQHVLIILLVLEFFLGILWMLCGIRSNWKQYRRQSASQSLRPHREDDRDRDS